MTNVKSLFEPKSVAIIGASSQEGKIGYSVIKNMLDSGYKGKIYPVNPKGGEVLGIKMFQNLEDIPETEIDLVTITIPAKMVFDAVRVCAKKKAKFLSIITSGFSEVGNAQEEKDMVKFARENGMRILGPNIFGIYSANASMDATFGAGGIIPGEVAIVTQSGALGIAMIGKTKVENVGLSALVSIGNKSDLDEAGLLSYLIEDKRTKVILLYLEGIKEGEKLVPILKEATKKKPIIAIKSGRSKRGAQAAASHTGSLAGTDEVFSDIMKQCGVLRAKTLDEAINWSRFLSQSPKLSGENCIIITNGGGVGVLAADACEDFDVPLYDDLKAMEAAFKDSVPSFGSLKNPIDITGGASMADYEKAIVSAFNNDDIHSIICLGCETAILTGATFKATIEKIHKQYANKKPVVYSFVGGEEIEEGIKYLRNNNVPIWSELTMAISCLGQLYKSYRTSKERVYEDKFSGTIDIKEIKKIIDGAKAEGRNFLLNDEGLAVMKLSGIPMPRAQVAKDRDEAAKFASSIGFPVVMKVVSRDILHKSDAGGVILNIKSEAEAKSAYDTIMTNSKNYKKDAVIKGVEICEMLKSGTEVIIGGRVDNSFGPTIMFGMGGIYVEVMKDIGFRAATFDERELEKLLKQTKTYKLLKGVRGQGERDIAGIIDILKRIAFVLKSLPEITDIEINPLVCYEKKEGLKAVDSRVMIK